MPEQGTNIGNAYATISLVLKGVKQARAQLEQEAKAAGQAIDGIGAKAKNTEQKTVSAFSGIANGITKARAEIKRFNDSPLGKVQSALEEIEKKIRGVYLAAGAFAAFGLKTSNDIRKLEIQFGALLGDQKKATAEMKKLRDFADDLNVPYTQVLEAAAALTPLVKSSGAEFSKLLLTTQKLATIDPAQGIQGARMALSEFMSGDVTSIFRRFELGVGKDVFKGIVDSANGDVNKMLDGLNKVLDKTGITTDAIREMADPFALLADEGKQLLDTAFRPFLLEVVIPLVKNLTQFFRDLRENNPELLKIGAGFTLAVAAAAPLLTIVTTLIGSFKALKAAAAGMNIAGGLKGIAGKGLAVGGGVIAGAAAAQGLADLGLRTGDLGRIASKEKGGKGENVMDVLGERLKQILVIVVNGFLDFSALLAKAVIYIGNAFDQFANVFRLGGAALGVIFGQLKEQFGNLAIGLADALSGLFDTTSIREGGKAAVAEARQQIDVSNAEGERLKARLAEGFTPHQSDLDRVDANLAEMKKNVLGGLIDFLFPVEKKTEEVAEGLEEAGQKISNALSEFEVEQLQEIADATEKYAEDVKKIEADKQQAILESNQKYADEMVQLAKDAAKAEKDALDDLIRDREKLNTDYTRDGEQDEIKKQRSIRDKIIDFQRKEAEEAQQHADKMVETRRKQQREEEDALTDLDFRKLFEMARDNADELAGDNQTFADQRAARQQALQYEMEDIERAAQDERADRLRKFEQDLYDRTMAYRQEQAQLQQENAEKLTLAHQQHVLELSQIQQKYTTELQLRQQAIQQELAFLMQSEEQRKQILLQKQQEFVNQAYALMGKATPQNVQQHYQQQNTQQAVNTARNAVQNTIQNVMNSPLAQGIQSFFNQSTKSTQPTNRASGGYLRAGQSSFVDESWSSQMERWVSGGRSYQLLGDTAILTPLKPGTVDPGRGRGNDRPAININLNIGSLATNGLTVEQAIPLIEAAAYNAATQALEEMPRE